MRFIKDNEFIRGKCPMTKEDVRTLSIVRMDIKEDSKVLDIGAGTGSISIQSALLCPRGKIISIEKNVEASNIIKQNIEKFNVKNVELIIGDANSPQVFDKVEGKFDSIFIGGSDGNIEDIISKYSDKLNENGNLVMNFITVINLYKAIEALENNGFSYECIQASTGKLRGKKGMIMANNPIFILKATKTL